MGADINIKLNIRATTEPSGVALGKQGRCVQKSDGDDDDGHRHDDDGDGDGEDRHGDGDGDGLLPYSHHQWCPPRWWKIMKI